MKVKTQYFTGLRPTGDLTLGNYLGAVKPIIDLQKNADEILFFIADIHGLTDQEPKIVAGNIDGLLLDLLSFGIDTDKTDIFVQSHIKEQVLYLSAILSRLISVAELMRVPALKDKLKDPENPERATVMLANYPIMMAADILLQGSVYVPVGDDQVSHIEVARLLAKRFNTNYGETFVPPKPQEVKPLRILSLTGQAKMSKSSPSGAIILDDPIDETLKKIKRAETAIEGEMNPVLESHFEIIRQIGGEEQIQQLDSIKQKHMAGEKVMGDFKNLLCGVVEDFLNQYQSRKEHFKSNPEEMVKILEKGNQKAKANADDVVAAVNKSMGLA